MPETPIRNLRESWAHFVASDCDGGFAYLHDAIEVILDDEPLYAAAPDLLRALEAIQERIAVYPELAVVDSLARAALAKAKGE